MSRADELQKIMDAKAANGVGIAMNVQDSRHVTFQVSSPAATTLVYKFQASQSVVSPDFSAAATTANHWTYIHVYDTNNPGAGVVGSTGVTVAGAEEIAAYLLNHDGVKWVNVEVSGYVGGSLTVNVRAFKNN